MSNEIKALREDGQPVALRGSGGGLLHNLPYQVVWTAKGYGWEAMSTTATASLIVRPSTLSAITLYNNSGSNAFVIERVMAFNLVSIANGQFGIWLCVHPVGMTAPTGNNITIRNSLNGKTVGSEGILDTAEAVTDNGWFPWGVNQTSVTATVPGSQAEAQVNGRIIIPPRAGLSVQCVAQTAVVTCTHGIHWFSVPASELAIS